MPSWPSRPPADDKLPPLRIIRTPAKGSFKGTIFSHELLGAMTHYAQNRTQLCTAPDCQACRDHQSPRWYGYIGVYNPTTAARAIFEFPAGPIASFNDYLVKWKDLLGARLVAYRKPARANGPVYVDLFPPDQQILKYPDELDLFRQLCQLWRLSHIDQLQDFNASNAKEGPKLAQPFAKPSNNPPGTPNRDESTTPVPSATDTIRARLKDKSDGPN